MFKLFRGRGYATGVLVTLVLISWLTNTSAAQPVTGAETKNSVAIDTSSLPPAIAAEATQRGFGLSTIKRQSNGWVACVECDGGAGYCVPLGHSATVARSSGEVSSTVKLRRIDDLHSGDTLQIEQYGQPVRQTSLSAKQVHSTSNVFQVGEIGQFIRTGADTFAFQLRNAAEARVYHRAQTEKVIDTLPRFRRETPTLVRTKDFKLVQQYIDDHPSEPFMVLVTVPALCEPCRQMDRLVNQSLATSDPRAGATKAFILEYFNFADAEREVLGQGALFPTMLVYSPAGETRRDIARTVGSLQGTSVAQLSRPLRDKLQRGAPHTLSRGLLTKETLLSLLQPARAGT